MARLYLSSPLREQDRLYIDKVKSALYELNQFYYKHDQFAIKLDSVSIQQNIFAGKAYNVYPDDIAKEIADTEFNELNNTDGMIVVIPPSYHECTTGVAVEIGYAIAKKIPILLFIDKTRPINNLSLTIRFYDKLYIHYIDDDIKLIITEFVRDINEQINHRSSNKLNVLTTIVLEDC